MNFVHRAAYPRPGRRSIRARHRGRGPDRAARSSRYSRYRCMRACPAWAHLRATCSRWSAISARADAVRCRRASARVAAASSPSNCPRRRRAGPATSYPTRNGLRRARRDNHIVFDELQRHVHHYIGGLQQQPGNLVEFDGNSPSSTRRRGVAQQHRPRAASSPTAHSSTATALASGKFAAPPQCVCAVCDLGERILTVRSGCPPSAPRLTRRPAPEGVTRRLRRPQCVSRQ